MVVFSGFYESYEPPSSSDACGIVPLHRNGHQNGQQSGYIFHHCYVDYCPGGRQGDTQQVVAQWRRPAASDKALIMLHQVMHSILHWRTTMAIEMPHKKTQLIFNNQLLLLSPTFSSNNTIDLVTIKCCSNCTCSTQWFQFNLLLQVLKYRPSRFRKVRSIFCHFVRRDTLHLSETVSCFFGRYDYTTIPFFTKYFLFNKISQRARGGYLPRSSSKHSDHGALPPCPKSCKKMTWRWYTSKKKNSAQLGLVRVDLTQRAIKKHRY